MQGIKRRVHYRNIRQIWLLVISAAVLLSTILFPNEVYAKRDGIQETVRIGYYENEVFQEGAAEDAEKSGYSYEYLQKVASVTGWKYRYTYGSWAQIYNMLVRGEIDLMAGLGHDVEREDLISYPDYPMGYENYYIYAHTDDTSITSNPESLNGKNIGALSGLMYKDLKKWLEEKEIDADIVVFDDASLRDKAFEIGALDAFIGQGFNVGARETTQPVINMGSVEIFLVVNKRRADLLKELNAALAQINSNDPYYVYTLSKKYYNQTAISLRVSDIEREWLEKHDYSIRVGYLNDYLPYCATDENGNPEGAIVDVLNKGFENLGIAEDVNIIYKGYDSNEELNEALNKDKVDTVYPVTDNIWYLDQHDMFRTKEVITTVTNLVYLDSINEDTMMTMAVNSKNEIQNEYVKKNFPQAERIYYDSITECIDAVRDGHVGSTVLDGLRTNQLLKGAKYNDLHYAQLSMGTSRCFGVSEGDSKLLSLLDRVINSLDDGEALSFCYKYIDNDNFMTFVDFLKRYAFSILIIAFVVVVSILTLISVIFVKSKKQALFYEHAYKDPLTGMFNRRAYEEDFDKYVKNPKEMGEFFTYVSMDLNGLKHANDNYGHAAGDELITAAGNILTTAFDSYGRVYRTGGDEYVAMLDVSKSNFALCMTVVEKMCEDFKGISQNGLTISIGRVRREEMPDASIMDIAREADKRMYADKSEYYKANKIDRRES